MLHSITRRGMMKIFAGTAVTAALRQARLLAQPASKMLQDAMATDTAPQSAGSAHHDDFGPVPVELPDDTRALRGRYSLRRLAHKHGLTAGAAIAVRSLQNDPALQELVREQYGILVPENELKWRALRPAPNQFDFTASDWLFAFAKQHHIAMRGHTLVWHNSVPDWLQQNAAQYDVRQLLVEHINTVVGRYKGRVQSWDVVNEAIVPKDGQADGLRKSFWYEYVGPEYIELAYRTAHAADPHARLAYNDYGVEYDNPEDAAKRELILALLERLKAKQTPLHAVGIQSHIRAGAKDSIGRGLTGYMAAIQRMGLEVYLTELDVNDDDLAMDDPSKRDEAVAATYRQYLGVALANPAVKLALTWGVSDRSTWLNGIASHRAKRPDRAQRALPFDAAYRATPALFAIRDSFDQRRG